MPIITITHEDLLRGTVVKPGWYRAKVASVTESPAQTDGSTNFTIQLVITEGDFVGVPLYRVYNEKALGLAKSFIEAVTGKKLEVQQGQAASFDLDKTIGHEVGVFVKNEQRNNRLVNNVEDFRPL